MNVEESVASLIGRDPRLPTSLKPGIVFKDITTSAQEPEAASPRAGPGSPSSAATIPADKVLAIESRGFIVGRDRWPTGSSWVPSSPQAGQAPGQDAALSHVLRSNTARNSPRDPRR